MQKIIFTTEEYVLNKALKGHSGRRNIIRRPFVPFRTSLITIVILFSYFHIFLLFY